MTDALAEVWGSLEPGPRPVALVRTPEAWQSAPAVAPTLRPPIRFEWVGGLDGEVNVPEQIVEGLISAGGTSVCFGPANCGKTYLLLHMGFCVSRGDSFLGKRTKAGAVIYIAGEGSVTTRCRLAAAVKHHGKNVGAFGLIPHALCLMDPSADVEDLIELVREKAAEIGQPVLLVIVDTLSRAMGGANENASEDMSRLVAAGDRIKEETGAHVAFIHHSGKDSDRGARGHSSLRAAIDTEIEVSADELTKLHTMTVTKQRDLATKGLQLAGRFVSVEVGRDQWGGPVTACAVEEAEPCEVSRRPKVMGAAQQAVMAFLAGKDTGVRRAAIVTALESAGLGRPSVYRAINALLVAGIVELSMGLVYQPKG